MTDISEGDIINDHLVINTYGEHVPPDRRKMQTHPCLGAPQGAPARRAAGCRAGSFRGPGLRGCPPRRRGGARRCIQGYPLSLLRRQGRSLQGRGAGQHRAGHRAVPAAHRTGHRQRIEQATGSNEELLTNVLTDWWHCFSQPHIGGIIKLIIAEASNFPEIARFFHEEVASIGHGVIRQLIQRGVERQEFRQPCEMDVAAHLVMSPLVMKLIWAHSMTQCGVPQLVPCGAEFIHHHVALILSLLRTPGTGLPGSSASAGDTTCLAPAGNPALPAHGAGPASPRTASDDRVASPAATSASAAAAAGTILWPSGHTCIPPCLQGHTPASREHTPASREHTPASREHASAPQEHTPASRGLSSTTAPGISGPTGHSRPAPTQPTPTQPT